MQNKKVVIISLLVLVVLFFGAGYAYKTNKSEQLASNVKANYSALVREHSVVIGNKDAKVELVEFFDPACETCAQMHPYVKEVMKNNAGNIKLVLRYAPFHKGSSNVVIMLEAAKEQNKFIEVLELLFNTQKIWTVNHQVDLNKLWGVLVVSKLLDMDKLITDMKNPDLIKIVEQDLADAKTLKATKTPAYYVNGKPLQVFGLQNLKDLINSEL
ncbi:DsbA family protein [Poseidonibacter ostreae]|uniref:Thioredoxin domain-containing protein n=1 Tax=Poseidonibacter ostreae TaxID=2654171 RepID=A0A6L4WYG8_9BACT|nr:thioredoxin domain-containing protein [Poseidonibacter ostreae]KAB7890786.1 thioredoxin domain-containing protein [Poseidonibacter ostreae]